MKTEELDLVIAGVSGAEVNALPPKIRRYIHALATRCDETGDTQTIWSQREQIEGLTKRVRELEAALTPSAATKGAYIGEFTFTVEAWDPDEECETTTTVTVPWTTTKEIMAAILAAATGGTDGDRVQE